MRARAALPLIFVSVLVSACGYFTPVKNTSLASSHPKLSSTGPKVKSRPQVSSHPIVSSSGTSTPVVPSTPTPTAVPASWKSPATIACGATFFPQGQMSSLQQKFGYDLSCFRFTGQDQWILVGSGQTANRRGMTNIGPMVAVDTCTTSTCLSPDAEHLLSSFQLSYPPNPAITLGLQTTYGTNVLIIANCNTFAFDTKTLQWYPESTATTQNLLAGKNAMPIATGALISAQTAFDGQMPPMYANACR